MRVGWKSVSSPHPVSFWLTKPFFFFPLRCWSICPSVHPGRSGRWASGGVPGYLPALGEEVQDPLLEDFVQVAGQAALGGDALALLQVVLDEDGLHDHVAHGAQVKRATQHLLGARPPRTRHPGRPSGRAWRPGHRRRLSLLVLVAGRHVLGWLLHLGDAIAPAACGSWILARSIFLCMFSNRSLNSLHGVNW